MVIGILKGYMVVSIIIMLLYAIRHLIFAYNRMFGKQRIYYTDVDSSDMPTVTVLIPMHNEELV